MLQVRVSEYGEYMYCIGTVDRITAMLLLACWVHASGWLTRSKSASATLLSTVLK